MAVGPETRRKVRKDIQPDGGQMTLYELDGTPDLFVDGLAVVMLGPVVSKLGFYVSEGVEQDVATGLTKEDRLLKLRLTIPTAALVEMMTFLTANLKASTAQLQDGVLRLQRQYEDFTKTALPNEAPK